MWDQHLSNIILRKSFRGQSLRKMGIRMSISAQHSSQTCWNTSFLRLLFGLAYSWVSPLLWHMLWYMFVLIAYSVNKLKWPYLWAGDLGRHGTGPVYDRLTQKFKITARKPTQVLEHKRSVRKIEKHCIIQSWILQIWMQIRWMKQFLCYITYCTCWTPELHQRQQNTRNNGKKPVGPQKDPLSTETANQTGRFCIYIQAHTECPSKGIQWLHEEEEEGKKLKLWYINYTWNSWDCWLFFL